MDARGLGVRVAPDLVRRAPGGARRAVRRPCPGRPSCATSSSMSSSGSTPGSMAAVSARTAPLNASNQSAEAAGSVVSIRRTLQLLGKDHMAFDASSLRFGDMIAAASALAAVHLHAVPLVQGIVRGFGQSQSESENAWRRSASSIFLLLLILVVIGAVVVRAIGAESTCRSRSGTSSSGPASWPRSTSCSGSSTCPVRSARPPTPWTRSGCGATSTSADRSGSSSRSSRRSAWRSAGSCRRASAVRRSRASTAAIGGAPGGGPLGGGQPGGYGGSPLVASPSAASRLASRGGQPVGGSPAAAQRAGAARAELGGVGTRVRAPRPPAAEPRAGLVRGPRGEARLRYWDGQQWTDQTADRPLG